MFTDFQYGDELASDYGLYVVKFDSSSGGSEMVVNALGYTPPTTNTTYSVATQSTNGLFSASDKKKLDGITSGSNTVMKLISSTDYSKLSDAQKKNGTVYFVV